MLGGGAGSIIHMIITLRNNQKLLGKNRPAYFLRDLSFGQKTKLYKVIPLKIKQEEPLSRSKKNQIQVKLKIKKRQELIRLLLLTLTVSSLVVIGFNMLLSKTFNFSYVVNKPRTSTATIEVGDHVNVYKQNMEYGFYRMRNHDWFFAAGNFNRALKVIPNDSEAKYYLAKSYCHLCLFRNQACDKATTVVNQLNEEYPNNSKAKKLQNYLAIKMQRETRVN